MTTQSAYPVSDALTSDEYVLGTDVDESFRLGLQHRLWSAQAHWIWERAGIQPGQTVLDLGCGPGHATMDLAQIVGASGRVIALDESAVFLKQLHDDAKARRMMHISRVLGDAHKCGSLLSEFKGKVDAVYARWLFCFVADPEAVISGMASLVKPGGKVIIQDYFNYEAMTLAPRLAE